MSDEKKPKLSQFNRKPRLISTNDLSALRQFSYAYGGPLPGGAGFPKSPSQIKVRVTDRGSIVADVYIRGVASYQVTVGGTEWNNGKGNPYQAQILQAAHATVDVAVYALEQVAKNSKR